MHPELGTMMPEICDAPNIANLSIIVHQIHNGGCVHLILRLSHIYYRIFKSTTPLKCAAYHVLSDFPFIERSGRKRFWATNGRV